MEASIILLVVGALVALGSTIVCFLLMMEKDMLKASVMCGALSALYSIILFVLMAPAILLVYIPVSIVLTTVLLILLVLKTERFEDAKWSDSYRLPISLALVTATLIAGLLLVVEGGWFGFYLPPVELRELAATIVDNTLPMIEESTTYLATFSSDAVSAIVWDYRGLDTFFESTVLYLAVISAFLLLYELYQRSNSQPDRISHSSPIALATAKLIFPLAIISSLAVILATHPGGGFPGGSLLASAIVVSVILARFKDSVLRLDSRALLLLALSCGGVLAISVVSLAPLLIGLLRGSEVYILQNQPKAISPIGYPNKVLGETIPGSIPLLEASESILVFSGLTLALILFAYSRVRLTEHERGDGYGDR